MRITPNVMYQIEHGCFAENQSPNLNQLFHKSANSMNNCSSSCQLPPILIWKENTRPLIALNTDHEQILTNGKI